MNPFNMEFGSYVPDSWFSGGLLLKIKRSEHQKSTAEKRASKWNVLPSKDALNICMVGLIVGISANISNELTLTNLHTMFSGVSPKHEKIPALPQISIREINKPFNEMFATFRAGAPLISSSETLRLAKAGVLKRNEQVDIEDWATTLAQDLKDAKD